MPRRFLLSIWTVALLLPSLAEAHPRCKSTGITLYICAATDFMSYWVAPLTLGVAVLFFLYGVMQFIIHAADVKERDEGKRLMLWGIIALAVAFSIFGLVEILGGTLGLPQGGVLLP